jgi:hypothetical protein
MPSDTIKVILVPQAQSYSASKRRNIDAEEESWLQTSATPSRPEDAVDIIGKIMHELGRIEKSEEAVDSDELSVRLGKISDMLYGVRTQLIQTSSALKEQNSQKLDFSPYSNGSSSAHDDDSSGLVKSPRKSDVLKTYMRNQLELQESEWENYEETINNLANQLESKIQEVESRDEIITRLTEERDDLVSMTTSLGDRLQALGHEKYVLLVEKEEWSAEKLLFASEKESWEVRLSQKEEELSASNQVRLVNAPLLHRTN